MKQLTIRKVPDDLHATLKQEAERDGRSLNFVVLKALRVFVDSIPTPKRAKGKR